VVFVVAEAVLGVVAAGGEVVLVIVLAGGAGLTRGKPDVTKAPEFCATPLEDGRGLGIGLVGGAGEMGLGAVGRAWAKPAEARTAAARVGLRKLGERSFEKHIVIAGATLMLPVMHRQIFEI